MTQLADEIRCRIKKVFSFAALVPIDADIDEKSSRDDERRSQRVQESHLAFRCEFASANIRREAVSREKYVIPLSLQSRLLANKER